MSDALQKVKRDLGRDAVILNTRTVNRGGLWRLGGGQMVEITAAKQKNVLHPSARRGNIVADLDGRGLKAEGGALAQPPDVTARDDAVDRLRREVGTVRSLVQDLLSESRQAHLSSVPQDLHQTYLHLIQQEVAAEITSQLLQQLRRELSPQQLADGAIVNARLGAYIEAMVPAGGPVICDRSDRAKVVVLVGPTGVGKTTTIAKLAASFKLREHRSVALVTIDTYRIAAVDQLRTYAQILDVPFKVVLTPDEFRDVLADLRRHDLIFVDTAGRSQNDTIKLNELRRFFESSKPDEVHLVLAGNCSHKVMLSAVRQFGSLGIDRVIFTKLDEAVGFGVALSVIKQVDAKLSYLTTGQDVPDDIEVGSGRRLAQLILGSPSLSGALGN
jgi:flagellar biosynthesis protein FlhF